ncbi:MAG: sensor histidine kinase [Calditrichaeota bacterium]|nr:sensor histidine kinase [Calditrichota bacterium]
MGRFLNPSSGRFKGFLLLSAVMLILVLLFYTKSIVEDLRDESRSIIEFYANLYARAASTESDTDLSFIFDEIIRRTNFPIIYTDKDNNPVSWKGIGIKPEDRRPESLVKVKKIMERMKEIATPIPIHYKDITLGYLYYGDSATITKLIWFPYIEIGVMGLFLFIAFMGFAAIKRGEQRLIWVGMAKETAHQLGTPLSSLMGWIELLDERTKNGKAVSDIITEMQQDVLRLQKVATRFSQIGSRADLEGRNLQELIQNVVTYFRRRLPQLGKKVEITLEMTELPPVAINPDLMEWVLENLIKNALDALDKENGKITITTGLVETNKNRVFVDISDNGKGIRYSDRKKIFKPGFSTKKRGWGLGLNLARRIVEEYHHGRLTIRETRPGAGTTMRIELRLD